MKQITLIIALLISMSLSAQQEMDSILQCIAVNNLELQALQKEHQARIQDKKSENTLPAPSIEYSPFYTKGYHGMASSEMIVSQEFEFPTLYVQHRQQIRQQGRVMDANYELRLREILLEARLLIFDIIRENQTLDLIGQRRDRAEMIERLLQQRLEAGDATILELNKARLELMQTRQELVNEENSKMFLLGQLTLMNGGTEVEVNERKFPEVDDKPTLQPFSVELPEVEEAKQELMLSEYNEKLARNSWLPSLNLGYRRNTEEGSKLHGVLLGASFPIYGTKKRIKSAQLQVEASQLQLEASQKEAERLQKVRYDELMRISKVLDHSDTRLMTNTLELLSKAMENGQITMLEYYTECNDIYEKLRSHISLHCEYMKKYAELYMR